MLTYFCMLFKVEIKIVTKNVQVFLDNMHAEALWGQFFISYCFYYGMKDGKRNHDLVFSNCGIIVRSLENTNESPESSERPTCRSLPGIKQMASG